MNHSYRLSEDDLESLAREVDSRATTSSAIDVITFEDRSEARLGLGIAGAVTVLVARRGSGVLDRIRSVLAENEHTTKSMRDTLSGLSGGFCGSALADALAHAPVFADIAFAGQVLNKGVFVPEGSDLAISILPFNGGHLRADGFTLEQHARDGAEADLEALAVQVAPSLTPAERAALRKVPTEEEFRNVGASAWCDTTWWDVAAFIVSATYAIDCTIILAAKDPEAVSAERLAELDSAASADELLAFRRDRLQRVFG